jgi:transcriptional regulator GlxA family with amidase domain
VFYLAPRFSMIAFAATLEPLRIANRLSRRELFAWSLVSQDGAPTHCSNGAGVVVDGGLEDVERQTTIVLCGGIDVHLAATRPLMTWLRKQVRRGARFGAVCTGAWLLAKAGFLDGKRCTIHWENREAFAEEFPEIDVSNHVYEIDGDLLTSAGGTAGADMMLDMISRSHGPDLASLVADQMIMAPVRASSEEQRLSVPARIGVRHPKLVSIIQKMERHIEEPISPSDLAREVGMSTRQLERLFRRYLDRSPKRYYMELRLQRARNLLLQTDMSVINVALACGFTSPSHFSKCYRAQYGRTPYRERGAPGRGGLSI